MLPTQALHLVGFRLLENKVLMDTHQHMGIAYPAHRAHNLFKGCLKTSPILFITDNLLPPVTSRHHVVNRTLIYYPQLPWHSG